MITASVLDHLFPAAAGIPEIYRLNGEIEQREYLVNGVLEIWPGPLARVHSPVHLTTDHGDEQVILGSTPLLDRKSVV